MNIFKDLSLESHNWLVQVLNSLSCEAYNGSSKLHQIASSDTTFYDQIKACIGLPRCSKQLCIEDELSKYNDNSKQSTVVVDIAHHDHSSSIYSESDHERVCELLECKKLGFNTFEKTESVPNGLDSSLDAQKPTLKQHIYGTTNLFQREHLSRNKITSFDDYRDETRTKSSAPANDFNLLLTDSKTPINTRLDANELSTNTNEGKTDASFSSLLADSVENVKFYSPIASLSDSHDKEKRDSLTKKDILHVSDFANITAIELTRNIGSCIEDQYLKDNLSDFTPDQIQNNNELEQKPTYFADKSKKTITEIKTESCSPGLHSVIEKASQQSLFASLPARDPFPQKKSLGPKIFNINKSAAKIQNLPTSHSGQSGSNDSAYSQIMQNSNAELAKLSKEVQTFNTSNVVKTEFPYQINSYGILPRSAVESHVKEKSIKNSKLKNCQNVQIIEKCSKEKLDSEVSIYKSTLDGLAFSPKMRYDRSLSTLNLKQEESQSLRDIQPLSQKLSILKKSLTRTLKSNSPQEVFRLNSTSDTSHNDNKSSENFDEFYYQNKVSSSAAHTNSNSGQKKYSTQKLYRQNDVKPVSIRIATASQREMELREKRRTQHKEKVINDKATQTSVEFKGGISESVGKPSIFKERALKIPDSNINNEEKTSKDGDKQFKPSSTVNKPTKASLSRQHHVTSIGNKTLVRISSNSNLKTRPNYLKPTAPIFMNERQLKRLAEDESESPKKKKMGHKFIKEKIPVLDFVKYTNEAIQSGNVETPQISADKLPEIDSEYSDEENNDVRKITSFPQWADSPQLRTLLERQRSINPDDIFGPIKPLQIEEIFKGKDGKEKNGISRFRPRSSSANWSGSDKLTLQEIKNYAKAMGYEESD